jgi:hypothetical protein
MQLLNTFLFGGENMKLKIWGTCDCGCGNRDFLILKSKVFQIRWFMDYSEWFLYIHIGKKYWRFSSAGFISSK